jgi:hypothetical protein
MKKVALAAVFLFFLGRIALAQSITVIQPAANVTWNIGGTYLIQWTSAGVTKPTVKIMLWTGSTFVTDIVASTPNTNSYSWTIPSTVAPGTYKVRVRAIGADTLGVSSAFNIAAAPGTPPATPAGPVKAIARPLDRPDIQLKFPALAITNITATFNGDGFVVTFGYKNSGSGPFPKGSSLPEKPNFRVLIDGREVNHGTLFFPEVPAQPGWELPTYQGCFVPNQAPIYAGPPNYQTHFDWEFTYGDRLQVIINENKVNGMESASKIYDLRGATLGFLYDAFIVNVSLDWEHENLTYTVRFLGNTSGLTRFEVVNRVDQNEWDYFPPPYYNPPPGWFLKAVDMIPGQHSYTFTQKMKWVKDAHEYPINLGILAYRPGLTKDRLDVKHSNNAYKYVFRR